ncbi:MAG: tRNA (guanosine(37)-N1)-methyltransferase TrmD [Clostridia bacterium]|nr:tRNA (guanosine(37)-N1)-methyltransferase TrmD [Clostridia bacterium]
MRIDFLTLFTDMVECYCSDSIVGRAREKGILDIRARNIRDYTADRQKRVDDAPFGGGMGMLMQIQPIDACYASLVEENGGEHIHLIYMSPKGRILTQQRALELSKMGRFAILCGRYEGVDERVIDTLVDEEISVGDYVVTGGELPGLMLADCVSRLVPGVLSDDVCFTEESHFSGLLEYPQYTRPADYNGLTVPEVLLSGHHANIERWRREQSLLITARRRPDMLEKCALTDADRRFLEKMKNEDPD